MGLFLRHAWGVALPLLGEAFLGLNHLWKMGWGWGGEWETVLVLKYGVMLGYLPPHTRLLQPPSGELGPEAWVETLIDPDLGGWNLDLLLRRLFALEDVACIGSVVISPLGQPNKFI
jgi:hypothetical protein